MNRELLTELIRYFREIPEPTPEQSALLQRLESGSAYYPVACISKSRIRSIGYDASGLTEKGMQRFAGIMGECYMEGRYDSDLHYTAGVTNLPETRLPECPNCFLHDTEPNSKKGKYSCNQCGYVWEPEKFNDPKQ